MVGVEGVAAVDDAQVCHDHRKFGRGDVAELLPLGQVQNAIDLKAGLPDRVGVPEIQMKRPPPR
jgi:hypothetical protein